MPACATARTVARQPAALTPGTLPLTHPHPPADHRRHVHPDISVWTLVLLHCCAALLHHPTAQEPPPFGLSQRNRAIKKPPESGQKAERKKLGRTLWYLRARGVPSENQKLHGEIPLEAEAYGRTLATFVRSSHLKRHEHIAKGARPHLTQPGAPTLP